MHVKIATQGLSIGVVKMLVETHYGKPEAPVVEGQIFHRRKG